MNNFHVLLPSSPILGPHSGLQNSPDTPSAAPGVCTDSSQFSQGIGPAVQSHAALEASGCSSGLRNLAGAAYGQEAPSGFLL